MLLRTESIVLRTIEYGEADLIVTLFTSEFGIVKAFAKSPRKTKSRFGSSLEPLTHAAVALWGKEDAALPRLTQSDILTPFDGLRSSFQCFSRVAEILELTAVVFPERQPEQDIFRLLLSTLRLLEQDCGSVLAVLCYKAKALHAAGFLPGLKKCGRCGAESNDFHLCHGTVLCGSCSRNEGQARTVSPGSVQLFRNLLVWDVGKLARIKPLEGQVEELSGILGDHIRFITERLPRTSVQR